MEIVGEVVLSVSLELLFTKLASSDLWKYARTEQVHTELKKWKKNLKEIREVLDDAENKQISDESVRRWLADLGNLAYDVEDVLDEFNYEALRRKLVAGADGAASTRKVHRFIPTCCSNFFPIHAKSNVKMGQKINEITRRLQEISGQQADLGLEKLKARIEGSRAASQSPIPPPLALESAVCGRDDDKKKIIAMLTDEQGPNVSVVSIVAMGGMGKTTLASLVHDDDKTCKLFPLKAWVCVSDPFDVETITRALLLQIAPDQKKLQDFHQIQLELRKQLKGKRFLIVLDDLWNEEYDLWDSLRSPLLEGAPGSKILVTTRNTKVAVMMGGDRSFYELKRLSNEDCWSVFQKHAFENMDVNKHPNLASLGRKIINKCGGLPLAAKALGGLLRHEKSEREWEKVLDSKIWGLPTDKCKILPALRLSYSHLPSHLKRCFTYCSIFPCDYEFSRDELIRLWMADGLIQPASNYDEKMEDIGGDYFDELLSRSFFQSSSSNRLRFVMHDLINDLAKFIAKDAFLHLDDLQCPISENTRHASITRYGYNTFNKFERFGDKEHLRTFIVLPIDESKDYLSHISNKVVLEMIPRLRHLRVLSLSDYWISEIPDSFGELKFLRYLNLSNTRIKCLPNSIGNLCNLQTLKLAHCRCLAELPISIGTLFNLRYLDVRGENQLEEMPRQISKLKNLQVLSNLIVSGSNNNLSIKELRDMPHLRGKLRISGLENVANIQDAMEGDLKSKSNLEGLVMRWESKSDDLADSNSHDSENERNRGNVLGFLQPHSNLKKLSIQSYDGPLFPGWINNPKFSKMVKLSLVNCRKCTSLPCLGMLPSLKHLRIEGMNGVKAVGAEFYGMASPSPSSICFQSLESLSFADMPNWEDWSSSSSCSLTESSPFPHLRQLTIKDCPQLIKELPAYLPSLMKLTIIDSPRFTSLLLRLPSLNELELDGCNEAVLGSGTDLTSLTRLRISEISGLIKLEEGFLWFLGELQDLEISCCQELINLWADGLGLKNLRCPRITDGHHQQWSSFPLGRNLKRLQLIDCDKLERLPNGWQTLASLEELSIEFCSELVSFPEVGFPPMLRNFSVQSCEGLKCLPNEMMMIQRNNKSNNGNNSCLLECLEIDDCSSLSCFPEGRLPTTLKKLVIRRCEMLKSLPDGMTMCSSDSMNATMCCLEHLYIRDCSSLTSFPNGRLPTTLKELHILDSENLESLPQGIMSMHHHSISIDFSPPPLQILELGRCSSLTSFPQGKFPSTLKKLMVFGYPQLESISGKMFDSIDNSLESLTIRDYPNLKTLPDCVYNLTELDIHNCKNLELLPHQFQSLTHLTSLVIHGCENVKIPLSQWGLTKLPSLKSLSIGRIGLCPNADSFSDNHHSCPLPTTLTFLKISVFHNLETLTSLSLQTLTSLRHLYILDCPKLQSILPRDGVLPATLSSLHIERCPLLKDWRSTDEGEDCRKIAHIPYVLTDSVSIF